MVRKIAWTAAALAALAGCASGPSGSAPTPNPAPAGATLSVASIVGEYRLVAIDGRALPVAPALKNLPSNSEAWPVVAGTLTVQANGTFQLETKYDPSAAGPRGAFRFSGTCYNAEDEVKMAWDGGGLTNLTLRADTLVLTNENIRYSYLRR
jgi:hypothetical protein